MTGIDLKEIFDKTTFRGVIKYDEPMSAHTSLKIGGPAEMMIFPENIASLTSALEALKKEGVPVFVMGSGTNLLVSDDGIEGAVLSLKAFRNIEIVKEGDAAVLSADAGVPLASLLAFAQKNGYSGLEAMTGIPGCFGGAIYMNAGSFGVEIRDVLVSVIVMDKNGEIAVLRKDEIDFSYRSSNLSRDLMILSAGIALKKDDPAAIAGRMKEFLQKKKGSQPLGESSAGCVFKNPAGDSAGRLIDAAGCKGMRAGDVEVSSLHANYFINKGKAACRDFLALMEIVKTRVREHSGIELQPEIRIVGRNT